MKSIIKNSELHSSGVFEYLIFITVSVFLLFLAQDSPLPNTSTVYYKFQMGPTILGFLAFLGQVCDAGLRPQKSFPLKPP